MKPSRTVSHLLALLSLLLLPYPSLSMSQPCTSKAFSKNRLFTSCNDLPSLGASLHWTYDPANSTLSIAFAARPARSGGWVAWGLNPTGAGMVGTQALVAMHGADGALTVRTFNVSSYAGVAVPSRIAFETWGMEAEEDDGGVITVFSTVKMPRGETRMNHVWQVGPGAVGGVPERHKFAPANLNAKGMLDVHGGINGISGSGAGSSVNERNIHGMLNAISWGILLPIGAIMARYVKGFTSLGAAWFYLHVPCQILGYTLGTTGWGIGLNLGSKSKGIPFTAHRNIGIALFSLATLQITALFLRPKKDHKYRKYWNMYHHSLGYAIILLGYINIFKGLSILNPGENWEIAVIVVIGILVAVALTFEVTAFVRNRGKKTAEDPEKLENGNDTHCQ